MARGNATRSSRGRQSGLWLKPPPSAVTFAFGRIAADGAVMSQKTKPTQERNEGEGNRTAARRYNDAQRRFVQSGKVEDKAREAEQSLDSSERRELERAEATGKRHIAEEDPAITRKSLGGYLIATGWRPELRRAPRGGTILATLASQ
jgi:hypothetical protein